MLAVQLFRLNFRGLALWGAGLTTVSAVVVFPDLRALVISALWCLFLFALTVGNVARLSSAFAAADISSHVMKRLIFQFGAPPEQLYFALTLVPAGLMLGCLATVAPQLLRARLPKSAVLLMVFLCWSVGITLWSPPGIDWRARLAALHQQVVPVLMFFCGLVIPFATLRHTAKVLIIIAGISVAYGVIQFVMGPTIIDTVWAEGASRYSLQAAKVHAYLYGANQEFRPFSIYADPLTWGLLLVTVFVLSQASKEAALLSRRWVRPAVIFTLVGLFVTLTRTPWAALAATVLVFRALVALPSLRRPWLMVALAILGFWAIVSGGRHMLNASFGWGTARWQESRVAARYATVGTLSARVGAGGMLVDLLGARRFLGEGLGYNSYYAGRIGDFHGDVAADSHNFVVELLLYLGLPGLCLFIWFYRQWLKEMFAASATGGAREARPFLLWIVAYSVGGILSGYLNGMTFMSGWFFFLLGTGARVAWLGMSDGNCARG